MTIPFRIASFNANSIRMRLDTVRAWLAEYDPDVLAIQETKVPDKDFPVRELTADGHHVVFHGQKMFNGVCLISKNAPADVRFGLDDGNDDDQARLIAARYGDVHVVNVYIPQGSEVGSDKFAYKLAWYERLHAYLIRHYTPADNLIVLGDFNVAPLDIDVYAPDFFEGEVGLHPSERAALQSIVDWGLTDVFRALHPEAAKQYTFFDYRTKDSAKYRKGWRIDHILATKSLVKHLSACAIDITPRLAENASDHTFIYADFALQTA